MLLVPVGTGVARAQSPDMVTDRPDPQARDFALDSERVHEGGRQAPARLRDF